MIDLFTFSAAGDDAPAMPGDVLLTYTRLSRNPASWFGALIRFGQAIRFRGDRRKYARWNHAVLVVEDGNIIEALGRGVVQRKLSDYRGQDYCIAHTFLDARDSRRVCGLASRLVGLRYGFLSIISIAIAIVTGGRLVVDVAGSYICSELVAESLKRAGYYFQVPASHIMPADLAETFRVDGVERVIC